MPARFSPTVCRHARRACGAPTNVPRWPRLPHHASDLAWPTPRASPPMEVVVIDVASHAQPFLAARDLLLRHRTDRDAAVAQFRWPQLERFNWALDWFDPMARGNAAPALWITGEDGREQRFSFDDMRRLSDAVAACLRAWGVKRRDVVLLMLGNEAALWESMLACIKLGAVVIPATTLLAHADLRDRIERGGVRHVVVDGSAARRSSTTCPATTRASPSAPACRAGTASTTRSRAAAAFVPDGTTRSHRPAAALLHVGHDGQAQARVAHARELSGRAPVDDVLDRAAARRRAPEHLLARLGQARVEQLLRAVERRRDGLRLQLRALRRAGAARRARRAPGDDALRAADRVAHADPAGPRRRAPRLRLREVDRRRRAAQPRGDRAGAQAPGG